MSLKSKIACEFSAERLSGGKPLYLWTFTFADLLPVDVACKRWQDLARDLVRRLGMFGLRAYELHPGGHGLHVHLLTTRRFHVNAVRRLSTLHEFGRINVTRIPSDAAKYIAKYLAKQNNGSRDESLKGKRLWQPLGKKLWPCPVSRVCDIQLHSATHDVFQILKGEGQLGYKKSMQFWRVAQLVVLGFLSLATDNSGIYISPTSVCSRCCSVHSRYDFPLLSGAYCFDSLEFDLGLPV